MTIRVARYHRYTGNLPYEVLAAVVLAFSSLARIWGKCSIIHSSPALFCVLFGLVLILVFEVEISSSALIPLFKLGSVHSGSES